MLHTRRRTCPHAELEGEKWASAERTSSRARARARGYNCAHEYYLPVSSRSKSQLRQMGRLNFRVRTLTRASSLRFLLPQFLRTITSLHGREKEKRELAAPRKTLSWSSERDRKRKTKILINRTEIHETAALHTLHLAFKAVYECSTVWRSGARRTRVREVLSDDNLSLNQRARIKKESERKREGERRGRYLLHLIRALAKRA